LELVPKDVNRIRESGGTILGSSGANPYLEGKEQAARAAFEDLGLDGVVAIGGDGTLQTAARRAEEGLPVVGIPKTIDNDLAGTDACIGFATAVQVATDAIDRLHTTAEAHHRVMIVEVMGRYAGWIALYAGVAGGADVILIPEIPFDLDRVAERIIARDRFGARFSIVVVAEGAKPLGGQVSVIKEGTPEFMERLGGMGARVAAELEKLTGKETRSVVLGHCSGRAPTSFDRVLATRFGARAVGSCWKGSSGRWWRFIRLISSPCRSIESSAEPATSRWTSTWCERRGRWGLRWETSWKLVEHIEVFQRATGVEHDDRVRGLDSAVREEHFERVERGAAFGCGADTLRARRVPHAADHVVVGYGERRAAALTHRTKHQEIADRFGHPQAVGDRSCALPHVERSAPCSNARTMGRNARPGRTPCGGR
jgi:6-phosphofructokinase 1